MKPELAHPEIHKLGLCSCTGDFRCNKCLFQMIHERDGKCECGTNSVRGQGHSHWCKMFRKEFK